MGRQAQLDGKAGECGTGLVPLNGSITIAKPKSQERRGFPNSRSIAAQWNIKPLAGSSLKTGSISLSLTALRLDPFC